MPTYVLPQVLVFQDFTTVPAVVANPLRAHITGPNAQLIRYAEEDEREDGRLGYYDNVVDTVYDWPNRPAGGVVDIDYTKVWMKDALLQYLMESSSLGHSMTKVASYNNRVHSDDLSFATNGDYLRHASLLDRDVKPGDVVKVRGTNSDDETVTLWTYVKSLVGDTVASSIETATADTDNKATQVQSETVTKIAGPDNCITVAADGADYDGLASGYVTETYDILVTGSSLNGDLTTATLRVISGSGTDDVTEVTPSAAGETTEIGTRGLLATIDVTPSDGCSASAVNDDITPLDLVAGQRWTITVNQAFTKPVATSAGDYEGTNDSTYIVKVSRGGAYADATQPQITVTTINGVDLSGPTTVTATATPVDIGTLGVTIAFSGTALRKGDLYYVEVVGETEGPMRNLVLGHNMDTDIADDSELEVTLFIRKPLLEIGENRLGFAPITNWETSETQITVASGIIAYDESWTDSGVPEPLDVYSEESQGYGLLYVEYRAWLQDLCNEVNGIFDVGDISDIPGAIDPDNPLKWAVAKALENANGTEVKYTSVCNPDLDENWADVLELLIGRDDIYGLVPLTRSRTPLDLYAAHVKAMSSPENGLWRVLFTSLEGVPEIPVVSAGSTVPGYTEATTTDDEVCLAVVEDDPLSTGTQYTIVRCTTENGNFLTSGVRAGDIVRMLYTGDGFGNYVYSEYVVDEVESEDELRLLTGPDAAINVAAKIEIWRNLTATEEAAAIAVNAGSWGDRRIRAVWPDQIDSGGTIQEGYHACAALAGLCSGVLPHQGLTRLEIVGFTGVARTIDKFNRTQLDAMAYAGTWIISQDRISGKIFSRHAVTTGDYNDVNQREEMFTRNVDSVSYRFKQFFDPYIGIINVTPVNEIRLRAETGKLINTLETESNTTNLGPQLISGDITYFGPHATLKDRYVLNLACVFPYPFNNGEIHLIVG